MELFEEVKNRYFQLVFRIINECAGGMAKSDILKIIDEGEFEQKAIDRNQQSFEDLLLNRCGDDDNLNLIAEQDGCFYPAIDKIGTPPIPVRLTNLEKAWLKALLEKKEVNLLLGKSVMEKLQKELDGFDTPIREEYFELTNRIKLPEIADKEAYAKNFALILEALSCEKLIRYSNIDKKGNIYTNRLALPVGIEYSMRDGRFRASMYSLDENRPIMVNIFSLTNVIITDEKSDIDRRKARELLFSQKYSDEQIVLEVTDKKAAMERCFMCFSGMERTARELGNNKYEIKLRFYTFEEENLIRNIISLGPYVKVVSPQRIADEVVARVRRSIALYE